MILYFTGTGNSEYVANHIGRETGDDVQPVMMRIRNRDYSEILSDNPLIVCSPTYGWQLPHLLRDWLSRVRLEGNNKICFVMTCGGEIDNAAKYNKLLAAKMKLEYMGTAQIIMPENYIAMFDTPNEDKARQIINQAEPSINIVIENIKSGSAIESPKTGIVGKTKSSIINSIYYPLLIHSKKFYVKDICIGCGLCERLCPLGAITMKNGKPIWNGSCTHCMACICHCPKEAIEYGKASEGKPRYVCPMT